MRRLLVFAVSLFVAENVSAQANHIAIPACDSSTNSGTAIQSSVLFAPSFSVVPAANNLTIIAPNAYTNHLGFFCRQELRTDKVTPLPVRFRVGSMEQCNWLEQKPGATLPQR